MTPGVGPSVLLATLLCLFQAGQTGSIEGTVREQDGTVAPGIQVALLNLTAEGPILRETTTDQEGRYVFNGLAPGTYVVEHELSNGFGAAVFARGVPETCAPLRPDEAELFRSRVRQVLQNRLSDHPFRQEVMPGSSRPLDMILPEHVPVTVHVRDSTGPVADALVMLVPSSLEGMRAWSPMIADPDSRTDETGTMAFPHVRPGLYCPVVRVDDIRILFGEEEVRAGDAEPLVVELGPYSVRVKLLDAHGEPIPSGKPMIQRGLDTLRGVTGPIQIEMWPNLALEAADGWLEVPYAVAGNYTVEGTAAYGNGRARAYATEVGPEHPKPEVTLNMPPMGSVVVKLTRPPGAAGSPVGVQIRQQGTSWSVSRTSTCPGEARFDHLVEGTYLVGEHAGPGWLPFRGDPLEVTVKAFETTEVTLVVPDAQE